MDTLMVTLAISDYMSAKFLLELFVENASYFLVFLFMVIESSFIPFPSEVVVPPAAYLAVTKGDMNVFVIVVVATLGALAGALINYGLSVWLGRPIVYAFADSRLGHACLIDRAKVEKAEKYFDDPGGSSANLHSGRYSPNEPLGVFGFHGIGRIGVELHIGGSGLLAWQDGSLVDAV